MFKLNNNRIIEMNTKSLDSAKQNRPNADPFRNDLGLTQTLTNKILNSKLNLDLVEIRKFF